MSRSIASSPHPRLLLLLSFVGFVALGLPDGLLGVAWPSMRHEFDAPLDALGLLFLTFTAGYVASSLATGPVLARLGVGGMLAVSCVLTGIGLGGYALAPSWLPIVAFGLLVGFGGGAIDTGINAYAAVQYSPRTVNVLHAFYGIGAAAGPALMTAILLAGASWRIGYAIVAAIEVVLVAAFVVTRRMWDAPRGEHEAIKAATFAQTLALPAMRWSIVVFLLYTGAEAAAGAWAYSIMREAYGAPLEAAGLAVTAYWVGLFASRLGYAFLPSNVRPDAVILASILTALLGIVVFALEAGVVLNGAAITLVGFASGPIFPSLIATTPQRIGAAHTGNAVGIQIATAAIGLAGLPSLCGAVAQHYGLTAVAWLLVICWTLLLAAFLILQRSR